jgi:glycosyltransferase involved in cell wall biosynthesis
MTIPVVSVIVPSYQSSETIRTCLDSLYSQDFHRAYEIIVVDSSSDSTPEIIRREYPGIKLIHLHEKTDPAAARNVGARIAQGDILAFIDSDCEAESDWLKHLFSGLQNGFSASGGSIRNANGDHPVSWAGYFCEFREFLPRGEKRENKNLTLGNAAYKKEAFWNAGAFPEGCFPQEDQVFHNQFLKKGYRINYNPGNFVWHRHRVKVPDFFLHQMNIGKANARVIHRLGLPGSFLVKHPTIALLALPGLIILRFTRTLFSCWSLENLIAFRRPSIILLCAFGMAWWGRGFIQGVNAIKKTGTGKRAISSG